MFFRTDLAQEAREYLGDKIDGIRVEEEKGKYLSVVRMHVDSIAAAEKMGKPVGTYVTLELPPFSDDYREPEEKIRKAAEELSALLPKEGLVLVAGLGNYNITPDNLGPLTVREVLATRHIRGELARSSGLDQLRPVAVIAPGVLGQTGIETGELIASLVKRLKPVVVIVVDALASRSLKRLGCTLQICDTGISPGAGVGNARPEISKRTLGVPVIGLGIPTVVDAATLAADLIGEGWEEQDLAVLRDQVAPRGEAMMVTPREIDLLVERGARMTAMAINCALHPAYSLSDLQMLVS